MKLLASVLRKRALTAALLLPVVLLSLVSTSFALWRCQFDGVARAACCCPKVPAGAAETEAQAAALPTRATLSTPDCCDLERYPSARPPAEVGRSNPAVAAVLAAAVVCSIPVGTLAALPVRFTPPVLPHEAGGPPVGRSLVVGKHAFLI